MHECPPNGQGLTALIALGILDSLQESGTIPPLATMEHNSAEYLHPIIEALRLAFADTMWYVADEQHVHVPVKELLSKEYLDGRAKVFDPKKASDIERGHPTSSSDTVYFSVVDKEGNACSFINSNCECEDEVAPKQGQEADLVAALPHRRRLWYLRRTQGMWLYAAEQRIVSHLTPCSPHPTHSHLPPPPSHPSQRVHPLPPTPQQRSPTKTSLPHDHPRPHHLGRHRRPFPLVRRNGRLEPTSRTDSSPPQHPPRPQRATGGRRAQDLYRARDAG